MENYGPYLSELVRRPKPKKPAVAGNKWFEIKSFTGNIKDFLQKKWGIKLRIVLPKTKEKNPLITIAVANWDESIPNDFRLGALSLLRLKPKDRNDAQYGKKVTDKSIMMKYSNLKILTDAYKKRG